MNQGGGFLPLLIVHKHSTHIRTNWTPHRYYSLCPQRHVHSFQFQRMNEILSLASEAIH